MLKQKKYDWKDSNMALFGSDTDKKVKKESADTEPAWQGAGEEVGVKIWRIVKFKVTNWDKSQYGEFYNGDSYIILKTYKESGSDELKYNVHFWIGKYSTQDEYGTAAYKTVELDTFLEDKPIQHREVQGHESKLFKSYFDALTLLKGGADTGFKRVLPETYEPRLLHIKKQGKKISCTEVSLKKGNLKDGDVFIIDTGTVLYQYNGSSCSHDEKFKAAQEVARIKSSRGGKVRSEALEQNSTSPDHPALMVLKDGESKPKTDAVGERKMFKVSDEDGSLDMDDIGEPLKDKLTSEDVYVINTGHHCFCWVGSGASIDERKNGLAYATNYLNKTATPWLPISVVGQGQETDAFNSGF